MSINTLNIEGTTYSTISTIRKVSLDGIEYNIGLDTGDATAIASDIISGKTAYANGSKLVGSIPVKGAQSYRPSTVDQTIVAGQYLSGNQIIKGDANLIPANIKTGISIFNINGRIVPACQRIIGPVEDEPLILEPGSYVFVTYRLSLSEYILDLYIKDSSGKRIIDAPLKIADWNSTRFYYGTYTKIFTESQSLTVGIIYPNSNTHFGIIHIIKI